MFGDLTGGVGQATMERRCTKASWSACNYLRRNLLSVDRSTLSFDP